MCGVVVLLLLFISFGGDWWGQKEELGNFLSCFRVISGCGTMKYMKLGSKPDVFQTEGSNIRLVDLFMP